MVNENTNVYDLGKVMWGTEYMIVEDVEEDITQESELKRRIDDHEAYARKTGDVSYELTLTNVDMRWRDKLRKQRKEQSRANNEGITVALFDFDGVGKPVLAVTYTECWINNINIKKINNTLEVKLEPLHEVLP